MSSDGLRRPPLAWYALWVGLASTFWPVLPAAAASERLRFGDGSEVTYQITSPFHTIRGVSHSIEGLFRLEGNTEGLKPEVPLTLSVALSSFASGNGNRDRHMRETMRSPIHPVVTIRLDKIQWDEATSEGTPGSASGIVRMLGIERPVNVVLVGHRQGERLSVDAGFEVGLEAHGVSRPRFLLQPIDERVTIRVHGEVVNEP